MDAIGVVLFVVATVFVVMALASRCPQCKRRLALRFTDEYRTVEKLGASFRQRRVACKWCHHSLWRDIGDSASGGGGP